MKTKIITISSGRGPAECCWVVSQVLKIILKEVRDVGLSYSIIEMEEAENKGTYHSVILSVEGDCIDEFQQSWEGTVQWIGLSIYRKNHKRKNWFVAVHFKDQGAESSCDLSQLKIQTMRSGGKGGQHVNKVSTAVRVTHIPTGISSTSSEQRSQLQNKKNAIQKLELKLKQIKLEQSGKTELENWSNKIIVSRGNPIRTFSSANNKEVKPKNGEKFKSKRRSLTRDLRMQLKDISNE